MVAALLPVTGGRELAEECVQDAFARALEHWPRDGVPRRPAAWVTTTARHRALDVLRRRTTEAAKLRELARSTPAEQACGPSGEAACGPSGEADERLRLLFGCCHPALAMPARVALALRALTGLGTAEIARVFLVSERTMGQRLFRARSGLRRAAIPLEVPSDDLPPERVPAVLAVLHLLFTEGYAATAGPGLLRPDLTDAALGTARQLAVHRPDDPEAQGLLALMLLHDARRATRTDAAGDPVLLADQDRSRWDGARIAEGLALLDRTLRLRRPGPYQIQAAIAACHAEAGIAADTDWAQIALLYRELARVAGGPAVELNRAVAVAMVDGPAAGLRLLDALAATGSLAGHHLLPAARADLLGRLGRRGEAAAAYREALALAGTDAERRFLARRLAGTADGGEAAG
ncbi:RNA polymerase sigma factor [Kitasatospora paranensis]|uniref:RNA polymerase sigma factor n=1 Tax=Kitasatospora paranensis TaxID=258053 RepID=A0ABW2FLK2_9ACTN